MISLRRRTCRWLASSAASLLLVAGMVRTVSAERPPGYRLLPDTIVAMASVTDTPDLARRFMNTATGRMSQDPQLKPLIRQIAGSIVQLTAELKDNIGVSLPEILAIPQGEITAALVAPEDGPMELVALMDVGDQLSNARKPIERLFAELDRQGTRKTLHTVADTKLTIYHDIGPERNPDGTDKRELVLFEKDATICLGTSLKVLTQMLAIWNGGEGSTAADNQKFATIMQRCSGSRGERPQIIWYADPIGIMRSIGENNTAARVGVAMLPVLGLDGLSAVGGSMIFDADPFDSIMHAHILLETPRSGVIKMVALEAGDSKPERWVPADVANYMTLHWNFQTTYKELARLFDSFQSQDALRNLLQGQVFDNLQIDFEKDLLSSLEGRLTMVTWFQQPVSLQSQNMLFAVKLKDTKVVQGVLDALATRFNQVIARREFAGKKYFKVDPPEFREQPPNQRPPLPCFGILDDYLLISNQTGIYEKALTTATEGLDSLADELDFKLMVSKISRQSGGSQPAMIFFSRPETAMKWIYDLASAEQSRTFLREQGESNPFFKSLNTALEQNPLPPFEVLKRYLAPEGAMVVDDLTGIHYTAFALRRKLD